MNILWRLKIFLKKKGWNDRLSNAQKLQTDNSATACAITDNQSRYSGIVACPFSFLGQRCIGCMQICPRFLLMR